MCILAYIHANPIPAKSKFDFPPFILFLADMLLILMASCWTAMSSLDLFLPFIAFLMMLMPYCELDMKDGIFQIKFGV